VQADGGLSAGLAMLGCLIISLMGTIAPGMLAITEDPTPSSDTPPSVASLDPTHHE
jgi:hypothetical protein